MSTTLMPLDPATSPRQAWRILTISAHLLPQEIVAARRAKRTRAWVLAVLVLVLILLAGWFLYAANAKSDAADELTTYATEAAALRRSQNKDFSDVVETQTKSDALDKELKIVMANDLPWATLLETLNAAAASAGVEITGVTGALTAAGTAGAPALPSSSRAATIGTLTLTGLAPDKPSVAQFVDKLGGLTTVANPYLTSAAQDDTGLQYSLLLDITGAAQCGRFSIPCKGAN
ncbi:MAG: hypothetical protein QOH97_2991 [Actinoplanes sp.]|jgi:hypothetical protein|nr:hypothetical protein [Actinoplanes sp.]